jgi:hypothetical protein
MVTTMNLALIGGLALLLALLVVLRSRRRKAAESAPAAAPASVPAPRPVQPSAPAVALAAAEAAATLAPVADEDAVAWPEIEDAKEEAHEDEAPAWSPDEVITEPGWPLPGEVGLSWPAQQPAESDAEPVTETLGPVTETPVADERADSAWDAIDGEDDEFDPASGWMVAPPADEAPAAELPVVEPVAEADDTWMHESEPDPAPVAWQESIPVAVETVEPEPAPIEDPEPVVDPVGWDQPFPSLNGSLDTAGLAGEISRSGVDPLARWAAMAPASRTPVPAPVVATRRPSAVDAWASLRPTSMGPAVDHRVAATLPMLRSILANGSEPEPRTGSFALGGFASQPGEEAVTTVSFAEVEPAPRRWRRGPSDNATPGTLILDVAETLNCESSDVAVITDPGFAPTGEGFIVRVAAREAGPFAARGTFRLR